MLQVAGVLPRLPSRPLQVLLFGRFAFISSVGGGTACRAVVRSFAGRHVRLLIKTYAGRLPPTRSHTHPTGPRQLTRQTHALEPPRRQEGWYSGSSLFAATTPLGREPAFTGAGPCLKRGQGQHADGRLVSTRSCSLRPCTRAPLQWHVLMQGRCCATAMAQQQASLGVTQSTTCPLGGAARLLHASHTAVWLSGHRLACGALRASAEIPVSQHPRAGS